MSKISDLAYALIEKTANKRISWEIEDESSISTKIGKNSINVLKAVDFAHDTYFKIYIQNIDETTIDEEGFYQNNILFEYLSEMMVRARRNSLKSDETLDEIIEKINKM